MICGYKTFLCWSREHLKLELLMKDSAQLPLDIKKKLPFGDLIHNKTDKMNKYFNIQTYFSGY